MTQELRPPRGINLFNAITRPLLAAGLPMGFNGLVTVRGRKSGAPRTTPIAIIQSGGRRWVWAPWGEVNWVRNLRAAGRATIEVRRQAEDVTATELGAAERLEFFRDTLRPLAKRIPGGMWFIRTMDGVDLNRPEEAAANRPVFELHAVG